MDVLFLARFQFALTIMFHYIFPVLSIGLGLLLNHGGDVFKDRGDSLFSDVPILDKNFCINFCYWCSNRNCHGI